MDTRKTYRMIALDLDDTLLNDSLEISEYTIRVIRNAQIRGIRVVIASGRPTESILPFAKKLELELYGGYIISYNGARITDCRNGQVLHERLVTSEEVSRLYSLSQQVGANIHTYLDGNIVTPKNNEYTEFEGNLTSMMIKEVDDFDGTVNQSVVKVLMVQEPAKLKEIEKKLRPIIHGNLSMNISKPFFLEFTNLQADKGKSLNVLAGLLGFGTEQVMAIGDSYNDISMLKECGLGVCVNNSPEEVKKLSDYITHSNNEDGVATAINRFALHY